MTSLNSTLSKKTLILLILSLLFLSACSQEAPVEEEVVLPPVPVTLWSAGERPVFFLKEVGTVKPFQEVEVMANTSGTIEELTVSVGDTVETDQVIGSIDPPNADPSSINLI